MPREPFVAPLSATLGSEMITALVAIATFIVGVRVGIGLGYRSAERRRLR